MFKKRDRIKSPVREIAATFKQRMRWSHNKPFIYDRQTNLIIDLSSRERVAIIDFDFRLSTEEKHFLYDAWQEICEEKRKVKDERLRTLLSWIYPKEDTDEK